MSDIQTVTVNPQGGLTFCDLSHGWRSDCAAGPLYPCYVEEVIPGDYMSLSFNAEVKTEPAKAPTMGTYDCYIETFFCRMANYYSQLHTNLPNAPMLEPGVGSFHTFVPDTASPYGVAAGSLMDYLGFPVGATYAIGANHNNVNVSAPVPAVPVLAYFDIFRSWYCDPQSPYFYYGRPSGNTSDANEWKQDNLSSLVDCLQAYYNATTPQTVALDPSQPEPNIGVEFIPQIVASNATPANLSIRTSNGGLLLGAYRPDLMNNFLSSDTVAGMLSRSSIVVVDGKITFDQIVATEKSYDFDNRSILSGGRYRDWVRSQYNVTPSTDLCQPQFLGRIHWTVGFQDVVANTAAENQALGELGGRGFGQTSNSRPIRMAFTDNGYIFSILRIVPRVDYCHYVEPYLQRVTTEDIFTPAYDQSPFEPVYYTDIDATATSFNIPSSGTPPTPEPVGYRPAWSGYRYRVNRSHGSFALSSQNYWVLQRSFSAIDKDAADTDVFTPYINPIDGNVPFANIGADARNFRVQIAISSKWRRPIKSNSLPSLK